MATADWGTGLSGFSETVQADIKRELINTLRAGLICLPKGAVIPATYKGGNGKTFTLTYTAYADFTDAAQSALTEGDAPTALKMGLDTQDITVDQVGAWAMWTDVAEYQSPHDLSGTAKSKIARLAAQGIDALALDALEAVSVDFDAGQALSTDLVIDAVANMENKNVERVDGRYYFITHPYAFAGLAREQNVGGFTDVSRDIDPKALTAGAVATYRGGTFLTSSRIVQDGSGNYPVYVLGKGSVAFGDISTISFHYFGASPDSGNPLQQKAGAGYKGYLGGEVISLPETTDGAGANGSAVPRIYVFSVTDGRSNQE